MTRSEDEVITFVSEQLNIIVTISTETEKTSISGLAAVFTSGTMSDAEVGITDSVLDSRKVDSIFRSIKVAVRILEEFTSEGGSRFLDSSRGVTFETEPILANIECQ